MSVNNVSSLYMSIISTLLCQNIYPIYVNDIFLCLSIIQIILFQRHKLAHDKPGAYKADQDSACNHNSHDQQQHIQTENLEELGELGPHEEKDPDQGQNCNKRRKDALEHSLDKERCPDEGLCRYDKLNSV